MRKSARAIIIKNEQILLIHRVKVGEEYWVFPGGGVEDTDKNEIAALIRECKEEIGVNVVVGDIFYKNEKEIFFFCEIISGEIGTGKGPEFQKESSYQGTYNFEWIHLDASCELKVLPNNIWLSLLKTRKRS